MPNEHVFHDQPLLHRRQSKRKAPPPTLPKMSSSSSGTPPPEESDNVASTSVSAPSFESLNLIPDLISALASLNYSKPTPIQAQSIPIALNDKDVIGVAKTGSGKTAAFALPILQKWWESLDAKGPANSSKGTYACVLVPTR